MKIPSTSLLKLTCLLCGISFSPLIQLSLALFYDLSVAPLTAVARAEAPADPGTLTQADKGPHEVYHVVKSGENLFRIGKAYDVPYKELARINSIQPHRLHVGQLIRIPGRAELIDIRPALYLNGEAPATNDGALGKILGEDADPEPTRNVDDTTANGEANDRGSELPATWELPVEVVASLQSTLEDPGLADQRDDMRGASSSEKTWLSQELWEEISSGFDARVNVLGFGIVQKPEGSQLNPNNILEIPRYRTELDLRPDFTLTFRRLELGLKPRFEVKWRKWDKGPRRGSERDEDFFIHEGFGRYRIIDPLILSYGRENLQWGPSYLFSPSNPFNRDNGRNNPKLEVPALDYGRVIWLPTDHWTLSFIANTNEGRQRRIGDFERGYAVKADYSGNGKYLTFIPSYREDGEFKFGFFGGWTVSDAFLLHTEGSFSNRIDKTDILVGGSYTLELGPTIVAEYFRNQNGCTRKPFELDRCFPPFAEVDPTDIFFRRNYLLLQYNHTRIRDTFNLVVRWTHNLDDHSNKIVNILEYELGERTRLFAIGHVFPGPKKTEFGSLLDYLVMLGISFTF